MTYVFDTSALINGWRYHYPPESFGTLWDQLSLAFDEGRFMSPRAVYHELKVMDDDLFDWAKQHREGFIDPSGEVQVEAGALQAKFFADSGTRDQADPWVIAEAKVRGFTVVTYEGTSLSGVPTLKANTKMPGFCAIEGVDCVIPGQALAGLGIRL